MLGGSLVDVIVFEREGGTATYYEEMPEDMAHARFGNRPVLRP